MKTEILAFNKWDCGDIAVQDPGIVKYITLQPTIVPKTGARYVGNRFHKSNTFIVERLINKVMVPGHKSKKHYRSSGHMNGKKIMAAQMVEKAFEIIEKQLKQNPVKVFVKALENAAPREEVIAIEYGGARYPKAVEVAPQRRIDIALRFMTQGAYQKSFKSKAPIEKTLAEEIMNAFNLSVKSAAISKKQELERQASSSK